MPDEIAPFSFGEMVDLHDRIKKEVPFFKNTSLPEFSALMREHSGSAAFDVGLEDSRVKRMSHGLDTALSYTGLPQASKALGGMIGSSIAGEGSHGQEMGEHIGETLPRGIAEAMAIVPAGAALVTGGLPALGIGSLLGAGLGAGSMMAGSYEKEGTALPGAVTAGMTALLPGSAQLGKFAMKSLLAPLTTEATTIATMGGRSVAGVLPKPGLGPLERGAEFVGGQLGATVNQELAYQGSRIAGGQGPDLSLGPDHMVNVLGMQLPFALLESPSVFRGPKAGEWRSEIERDAAAKTAKAVQGDIEDYLKTSAAVVNTIPNSEPLGPYLRQPKALLGRGAVNLEGGEGFTYGNAPKGGFVEINNQQIPTELFPQYNRAMAMLDRRDTLSMNDLKNRLGMASDDARQVMQLLEDKGMVEKPTLQGYGVGGEPLYGPRKVLKSPSPTDSEIVIEAVKKYFPNETTKPLEMSLQPPEGSLQGTTSIGPDDLFYKERYGAGGVAGNFPPSIKAEAPPEVAPGKVVPMPPRKPSLDVSQPSDFQRQVADASPGTLAEVSKPFEPRTRDELFQRAGEILDEVYKVVAGATNSERIMRVGDKIETVKAGHPGLTRLRSMLELRGEMEDMLKAGMPGEVALERTFNKVMLEVAKGDINLRVLADDFNARLGAMSGQEYTAFHHEILERIGRLQGLVAKLPNEGKMVDGQGTKSRLTGRVREWQPGFADRFINTLNEVVNWVDRKLQPDGSSRSVPNRPLDAEEMIYAAATKFLEDEANITAKWKQHQDRSVVEGWEKQSPDEQRLQVLRDYTRTRGIMGDEAVMSRNRLQAEEDEKLQARVEQKAEKTAEDEASSKALADKVKALLPSHISSDYWEQAYLQILGKTKMRNKDHVVGNLNTVLRLLHEGQIGVKPSGVLSIVKGGYIKSEAHLANMLGYKHPADSVRFVRETFLPLVKHFAEQKTADPTFPLESAAPKGWESIETSEGTLPGEINKPSLAGTNLFGGAETFFKKYALDHGLEDPEVFTNTALRIAALFKDINHLRVASLVSHNVAGTMAGRRPGGEAGTSFIGLNDELYPDTPTGRFMRMQTFGHELMHGVQMESSPMTRQWWTAAKDWASKLTPQQRLETIEGMLKASIPDGAQDKFINDYIANRGRHASENTAEFLADYAGLTAASLASPMRGATAKAIGEGVLLSGFDEQQFAKGLFLKIDDYMSAVHDYLDNTGQVQFAEALRNIQSNVKMVMNDVATADKIVGMWRDLEAAEPERFFAAVTEGSLPSVNYRALKALYDVGVSVNSEMPAEMALTSKQAMQDMRDATGLGRKDKAEQMYGQEPGWIARTFEPAAQISERFPRLRPVMDLMYAFRAMANDSAFKLLTPFLKSTGKKGEAIIDYQRTGLDTVLNSEAAQEAVTKIGLLKGTLKRLPTAKEKEPYLLGLGDKARKAVLDFHSAVEEAAPLSIAIMGKRMMDRSITSTAGILMARDKTLKYNDAMQLGQEFLNLWGTTATSGVVDPVASQALAAKVGANFQSAMDMTQAMATNAKTFIDTYSNRPHFMPEMRLGRWYVSWIEPGEKAPGVLGFKTKEESVKFYEKKEQEGKTPKAWDKYQTDKWDSGAEGLRSAYDQIDTTVNRVAETILGKGTEALKDFQETLGAGLEPIMKEVKSRGGTQKYFLERKLAPGREALNFAEGFLHYIAGVSTGVAKQHAQERANLMLRDPELMQNKALRQLAFDHTRNVLSPSAKEWTGFKNLIFTSYMAMNVSSMLVELSQPLSSLAPFLTQQGGSVLNGYKTIGNAVSMLVGAKTKGKLEPRYEEAVQRAEHEGTIGRGWTSELYNMEDVGVANLRNLADGGKTVTPLSLTKNAAYGYLNATRGIYTAFTSWNDRVAFLSGLLHAEHQGLKGEEAFQFASRTAKVTMYGGGKAGRPVGLFANKGEAQGLIGAAYSLQTFTASSIAMMARYGLQSIDKGLTGEARSSARKAFGQMLLTQVAMGGALSLPVAAALNALNAQFPELELKKNVRVATHNAFKAVVGGDEELGGLLADIALKGVAGKMSGTDISSRVSLANILGVDAQDGFNVANLLGPGGSLLKNLAHGAAQLAIGDVAKAAETIVPNAYKNALRLHNDGGDVRMADGRLMEKLSPMQQTMLAIGFRPSGVSDFREQDALITQSEKAASAKTERFHSDLADQFEKGDFAGVQQKLLDRALNVEGYSARAGARRVVEMVQDRHTPVDLLATGRKDNAASRQEIASTYEARPRQLESQRLSERLAGERALGVPGVPSPTQMSQAMMVDRLISQNPLMTRGQAQQLVERLVSRPRRVPPEQSVPLFPLSR